MKKIFAIILIFMSITLPSFAYTTLYQNIKESTISSGTKLKNYTLFTDGGWLNINVLEVDTTDDYTKIDILSSSNGLNTLQSLKKMSENVGAIAAINGDFFSASSGKGHSMGLVLKDSTVLSSAYSGNHDENTFASFLLDDDNNFIYDYVSNTISLKSLKTKEEISILNINKYPSDYSTPTIYTTDWGKSSPGASEDLPMVEIVVKDSKVMEVRENLEGTQIPEGGFIVSAVNEGATFLKENFKVGNKVGLDIEYTPDLENIKLAISGGSRLIEDGEICDTFTDKITGKHPRSAIGSSFDDKKLFLVTVDGRQKASIGLTEKELAEFLLSIGVYNAINLDGGGSTSMVAKKLGENTISTINLPSGGSLRSIINGIGVFSTAPESSTLKGLIIDIKDTNIFINKKREVTIKGYNKYFSPVAVNINDVVWSYDGVPVSVDENGIITGDTVGSTILTASIGKIKASTEINILSDVNELSISPKKSTINTGEKISFEVYAKNKNGYYATLNSNEVTWKIESGEGILTSNIFTATKSGDVVISVNDGHAITYALITVSGKIANVVYDFEDVNYIFDPYPDEVSGNAELSPEQSHSGKYSSKLSYDFRQDIKIRAAYIEFKNKGIAIPENTTDLSFWVYNDSVKQDILKIKLCDANGSYHLVIIQRGISHTGWKEFSYSLSNISLPAKITDIYIAQDDVAIQSKGYVYVDDLTFHSNSSVTESTIKLPRDIKGIDTQNKESPLNNEDSFRIAFTDAILDGTLMIDNLRNKKMEFAINTSSDIAIFTSQKDKNLLVNIIPDTIICEKYSGATFKNSSFITIDVSNKGIRQTDSSQWLKLQNDIKKSLSDNIFIILNSSLDNFSDDKEKILFINVLCELKRETNKNIWVLHKGSYTDYSMERGVKYLGINNLDIKHDDATDIAQNNKFILITVNGKDITYEIRKLF